MLCEKGCWFLLLVVLVCFVLIGGVQVSLEAMGRAWGFQGEGEWCHSGMMNAADCIARVRRS